MPPRTRKTRTTPQTSITPPPKTFHQFGSLPLELRLQIWNYSIQPDFIPVRWDSSHRVFWSPRRPPPILHVNSESRREGVKHYRLALAASPEFARVYVNFKIDLVYFAWHTLGATDEAPGRLGRKLCESDYERLEGLMIHENDLLRHMDDEFREVTKFKNLKCIAVVCDEDNPESGDMYGEEAMMEMAEAIDNLEGPYTETWPELICLRCMPDGAAPCSRHWWFDGWNQRTRIKQKEEWTRIMAECLEVTMDETGGGTMGPGQFFFNMMMAHALGGNSSDEDEDEDEDGDSVDSDDLPPLVGQ